MKKFEYRLEKFNVDIKQVFNQDHQGESDLLINKLDELGNQGWRLCGVNGSCYYFTREK